MAIDPKTDSSAGGPLAGVRVVELGSLLAGPYTTRLLGDFGAEIIKVENPGLGDPLRDWGHHHYKNRSLWWPVQSRNKKCITLDLRQSEGKELFLRIIKDADVLVENFRPGTLEKWGLGWDVLSGQNPRLIMARVSGYGQTGPYAGRPGFASVGEAMGGLRYVNGFPGQAPPRTGISLGDSLAAMFAAQGILMALYWRDGIGSGRGQVIDASIMESCFTLMESAVPEYDRLGVIREPSGTGLAGVVPSNIYKAKGGEWMVIAANNDNLFRRLCQAMGKPELATDPRYSTHTARTSQGPVLDAIIGEWSATLDAQEIEAVLQESGVVCGPIYTIADIFKDPHYQARSMLIPMHDPDIGDFVGPGIVPKLTESPGSVRWSGPAAPGSHNEEIFCSQLGLSKADLEELGKKGVV